MTSPGMESDQTPGSQDVRVVRHGRVSWLTGPPDGVARIGVESRAFGGLPVSLPERDPVPLESTPGELLAIAHAMSMAWAVSALLVAGGSPADELVVEGDASFGGRVEERELLHIHLRVRARVPGIDEPGFREAVRLAEARYRRNCGLGEHLAIQVDASLVSSFDGR
jgi:osmotically inducible protein OsmC